MKQQKISNLTFVSFFALLFLFSLGMCSQVVYGQASSSCSTVKNQDGSIPQCCNGIDDNIGDGIDYGFGKGAGDKQIDFYGAGSGADMIQADPKCNNPYDTERETNPSTSKIIPCTDKCDINSVFALLNNGINFVFEVILFPIMILMFIYAGYKYIMAQGNPSGKANVKKMIGHLIGGVVIMLCAWLIVKTILVVVGYEDGLLFFQ